MAIDLDHATQTAMAWLYQHQAPPEVIARIALAMPNMTLVTTIGAQRR